MFFIHQFSIRILLIRLKRPLQYKHTILLFFSQKQDEYDRKRDGEWVCVFSSSLIIVDRQLDDRMGYSICLCTLWVVWIRSYSFFSVLLFIPNGQNGRWTKKKKKPNEKHIIDKRMRIKNKISRTIFSYLSHGITYGKQKKCVHNIYMYNILSIAYPKYTNTSGVNKYK